MLLAVHVIDYCRLLFSGHYPNEIQVLLSPCTYTNSDMHLNNSDFIELFDTS